MRANATCLACLLNKQEQNLRPFKDEDKKFKCLRESLKLLYNYGEEHSAPWLSSKLEELFYECYQERTDYSQIKHKYNQYMLSKETLVENRIRNSEDKIAQCIKYVCAGNFIDFGTGIHVDDTILEKLLDKAHSEEVNPVTLARFKDELTSAKELVYLTDNCGEIVMDKIFIKILQEEYPNLHITAILRETPVINDATLEDAREIGLTKITDCIGNGSAMAIPGTSLDEISEEALAMINKADVIISKGQGNFEELYGENKNPYFLFLCKCELFVRRFGLKQFSSVFEKEENIHIK